MKKNITLYSLKAIACFFVVCIHVNFPGKVGETVVNIARFAVPAFFMISGFFSYDSDKEKNSLRLNNRIKELVKLIIICFVGYFLLNIFINFKQGSLELYFSGVFNYKNFLKFILLNWTTPYVGVGHLWYLFALLYVYIIIKVVNKYNLYKIGYIYSFVAIILMYFFEIYNSINNMHISQIYYRNAFIMGLSFFLLGHFIRKHENLFKMKNFELNFISVIFILLIPVVYAVECRFMNNDNCVFLNGVLFDILIFIISINKSNIDFFSNIGENDSSNIYIVSYAILFIINLYFIKNMGAFTITHLPLLVFIVSYIYSILYRKFIRKLAIEVKIKLKELKDIKEG
jgi:surface polysaccharide O-acyltransferase-like enzyme